MHSDTTAILALLKSSARDGLLRRQRVANPNSQPATSATSARTSVSLRTGARLPASVEPQAPRARDGRGRFAAASLDMTPVANAVESLTRQEAQRQAAEKRADESRAAQSKGAGDVERVRDARGRFGSGGADGGGSDRAGLIGRSKLLMPGFSGGTGDLEKVDPTVEAAKEVSQLVATPLKAVGAVATTVGRGFNLVGAGKDGATPWYRRMWTELRGIRRQEGDFGLAQTRTLKEIERKTGAAAEHGSGGGLGGMLGGLLGKGGGLMGSLMAAGKGALKRLPLLGALFAGGSALASIFGSDDPTKTAGENRRDRFTGAASGIGALIGGGLGMLLGPVGALVGGVIGDKVGELVGAWLSTVDWSKVGAQITGTWNSAVGFIKNSWSSIIAGAKAFLKDKFGIDVDTITALAQEKAQAATDYVKEKAAPVVDTVKQGLNATKDGAKAVVDYGKERAATMAEPIRRTVTAIGGKIEKRWSDAKQYLLGASNKADVDAGTLAKITNFESGFNSEAAPIKKDGSRISSAHGYGQFLDGTWTDMVNKHGAKYGIQGAGKLTKEQAAAYRSDKTIQAGMLAEFTRENIEKGRKYGGDNDDANVYAFHNLGDKDAKNLLQGIKQNPSMSVRDALLAGSASDKERARIEKVISGNRSLYGDGNISAADAYAKMGQVMQRGDSFAADARLAQAGATATSSALSRVAAATAPAAPPRVTEPTIAVPAAPAIPPASQASIPTPINSKAPMEVRVTNDQPASQDLRDRRLAMIATGGLGG